MNKKLKQLKNFCSAVNKLTLTEVKCKEQVGQVLTTEEKEKLINTAKKKYDKKLKNIAKKLLNRKPTQEELDFINDVATINK